MSKYFRKLLIHEGNIKIREWPGHKLHAKFVIIDRQHVFSGSYNWSSSAGENTELMLEFDDSKSVGRFVKLFDDVWKKAEQL